MNREQLVRAIQYIEENIELPKYIRDILLSVREGECHSKVVDGFLCKYNVPESVAKIDFLNLVLEYIKAILESDGLTEETRDNIHFLKILLRIHPGDFYRHKKPEIEQLIKCQLAKFYDDDKVSPEEAFLKTAIQELFDLSYDQMNDYAKSEALSLFYRGVNPMELDVLLTHNEYSQLLKEAASFNS